MDPQLWSSADHRASRLLATKRRKSYPSTAGLAACAATAAAFEFPKSCEDTEKVGILVTKITFLYLDEGVDYIHHLKKALLADHNRAVGNSHYLGRGKCYDNSERWR